MLTDELTYNETMMKQVGKIMKFFLMHLYAIMGWSRQNISDVFKIKMFYKTQFGFLWMQCVN